MNKVFPNGSPEIENLKKPDNQIKKIITVVIDSRERPHKKGFTEIYEDGHVRLIIKWE